LTGCCAARLTQLIRSPRPRRRLPLRLVGPCRPSSHWRWCWTVRWSAHLLRAGDPREPGHREVRPSATDLRDVRKP